MVRRHGSVVAMVVCALLTIGHVHDASAAGAFGGPPGTDCTVYENALAAETNSAAVATVCLPEMRLPWAAGERTFTGGPHGKAEEPSPCALRSLQDMSGLDFGMSLGTPVLAVAAGRVVYAGPGYSGDKVIIDHGAGFATEYWHLQKVDDSIRTGMVVPQGKLLGESGYPKAPHLHLEFTNLLTNKPYSAHGMTIDEYTFWTYVKVSDGLGYSYEGTATRGTATDKTESYPRCGNVTIRKWSGSSGTITAEVNGAPAITSTNRLATDRCGIERGSVGGYVKRAGDCWPVGNALVKLVCCGEAVSTSTTDITGQYSFASVPQGEARIVALSAFGEGETSMVVRGWVSNQAPDLFVSVPQEVCPSTSDADAGARDEELRASDECVGTDGAEFIAHVTIPDGAVVSSGQTLRKTWRLKNTGTSTWGSGYELAFVGGDQMGTPASVSLPHNVVPDDFVDATVNMTAPSSSGDYQGYWRMRNAQGVYFGETIWIKVTVPPGPAPTPPPTGDIEIVSAEYPSVVTPGQTFRPRVTVRVIEGRLLQSRGDMLRNTDGNLYGAWPHVAVVGSVNSGQTFPFEFYEDHPITAPPGEGTYESKWHVWRDGNWVGPEITIRFDVRNVIGERPNPPALVSPANWSVSRDGSTPTLCASAPAGLQYYFDIFEGLNTPKSDWISSNCWTPSSLRPGIYYWHVKVRNSATRLESDWSETWHFSIDSQELTMDNLVFSPASPSPADEVRVYACVHGFGEIGLGLKIEANTATDGSASGEWQWIHHLGKFCYDRNDPSTWPSWWTLPLEDGTHLIRATGYHGDDTIVKEAMYTLRRRRPNGPAHIAPSRGTYVNSRTVTFHWTASVRVQSYRLVVSTDAAQQNRVLDQTLPSGTTEFATTLGQDYALLYWSVVASNGLGSESSGCWEFGIDRVSPSSAVSSLPPTSPETKLVVQWNGSDDRSGLRWYDVQYRDGERGVWTDWLANTTSIAAIFTGQAGHTYYFRVRALDNAGNLESYPDGDGDTHTCVDLNPTPTLWWNSAYSSKRNLVILNNDSRALPAGYPIRLHFDNGTAPTAGELYSASQSSIKGGDFRVIFNNQTELQCYVQTFRSDRIDIWFSVRDSIGATPGSDSTSYQLYYGNPAASQPPGSINDVIPESSDGNTLGLWHFDDGSGTTVSDRSGNGRQGTASSMAWTEGKFGTAGVFNGTNSLVNMGTSAAFNAPNITLEAWIKQTSQGWSPEWTILRKEANDTSLIYDFQTCDNRVYLRLNGNDGYVRSNTVLQLNRWYHVAGTYDGSSIRLYINGDLDNSQAFNTPLRYGASTTLYLGGDGKNNNKYFPGHIQNVRISNTARASFVYGSFGKILNEPSSGAGDAVRPPAAGSPNLAVLSLAGYPSEQGLVVQAVVRNRGDASTRNGFFTDLYKNHRPEGARDYEGSIHFWAATPIEPGETITLTTAITDPVTLSASRAQGIGVMSETTSTLYVQADSTGVVSETDKIDNISGGVDVCVASPDAYEPDDSAEYARSITLGQAQEHNFHRSGDQDWLKFVAQAGTTYTVSTSGLGPSCDTYLYLYGTDRTALLASNDDYSGTLASRIDWLAPASGTYYLMVRHWNPDAGGCGTTYDVVIQHSPGQPDLRADPVLASPVKGACNVGVLYAGKPTYFDGGFTNIGSGTAVGTFQVELSLDGASQGRRDFSDIAAGARGTFEDWALTVQESGQHTVTLTVDPDNDIAESSKENNTWNGRLTWEPVHGWWGEYFNNETLSGDPVFVRDDHEINFDWEAGSPDPCVNADNFSIRWTRTLPFEAGTYCFNVFHDDGARLRIDDVLVLDKWGWGREWDAITRTLTAGNHTIEMDALELGGWASAKLSWARCSYPDGQIAFGWVVPGEIRRAGEVYTYTLRVDSAQWISARMIGSGSLDAYLELRDENGTLLMYDNDGAWGMSAFFTYPLPAAGSYKIVARGYGASTGPYRLRVDPSRTAHPTDITADCRVDEADLTALLGCWSSVVPPCDTADLNLDQTVNILDQTILLGQWGRTCPSAAVYIRGYPQQARGGGPVAIRWTVIGTSAVTHTDIHWGTQPGSYDRRGASHSGDPGDYEDTLAVGDTSNLYFVAHAQVGGNDYYSSEFSIPISASALQREAEDGVIEPPMVIGFDVGASNGKYVYSSVGQNGQVTLSFYVPEGGDYQVWGRAWGDGLNADSFTVKVDGGPLVTWDVPSDGWTWVPVTNRDSAAKTLVQNYHLAGTSWHTVTVRARGALARLDVVELRPSQPPQQACFTASPTSGPAPLAVQFSDCSTGTISSRLWFFGDGQTGTELTPAHVYTAAGMYTVTLVVSGPDSSHVLMRPSFVTVTRPLTPMVSILPAVTTADAGSLVTVAVVISDVTNLGSFTFTLAYSPGLASVQDITGGDFLRGCGRTYITLPAAIDNVAGRAAFGVFSLGSTPPGCSGSGALAYIRLEPRAQGASPLHLANVQVSDVTGAIIPVILQDGTLVSRGCPWDFNRNGTVDMGDLQAIAYRWSKRCGEPLYDPIYDLDGDCYISIVDVQRVANHLGTVCALLTRLEPETSSLQRAGTVSIQPSSATVSVGSTFTVGVVISDAVDLGAFEFSMAYGPSIIEVITATLGSFPGSTGRSVVPTGPVIDPGAGTVTFAAYSLGGATPGPTGNGHLAVLSLKALASGASGLHFVSGQVADRTGETQPTAWSDGQVLVMALERRIFLPVLIRRSA